MPEAPLAGAAGTGITGRNAGLDLARAAAITMVLFSHIASYGFTLSDHAEQLVDLVGGLGVELFFSLSGFLIGRILLRLANDPRPGAVATFLGRRWLRTLPLYYAVLLLSCWMFQRLDRPAFVFLQTVWPNEASLVPQSWSLVLEEMFYLGFPLLMLAMQGAGHGPRLVLRVAALLIAAAWIARFADVVSGLGLDVRSYPFMRLDCAAYGVVAACLDARVHRPPRGGPLLALVAAGSVTLCFAALGWVPLPGWTGRLIGAAKWPIFDAVFALLVWALFYSVRWLPPGVRLTSRLSYSIYLIHLLILAFMLHPLFERAGAFLGTLCLVTIIIGLAGLTWALVEQPFLLLRRHLANG